MRRIWLAAFCLLWACSCAHLPWRAPHEDPRTKGEEGIDPLGYPQDQVIVTQTTPAEQAGNARTWSEQNHLQPAQAQTPDSAVAQRVYRVQFFATKYPDEASQVAETVGNMVSEKTYMDYKTPYYWVRAGDCRTKEEAERLLQKIKGLGYKESWVVEVGPED